MRTDWYSLLLRYFGLLTTVNQTTVVRSAGANICDGTALTDELRNIILDKHNAYRTELATGKSMIKGGQLASSAKNMYKLVCLY